MYKLISFDLDDTLSPAKSRADLEMIDLLTELLKKYKVSIITWGKFETIDFQVISQFEDINLLKNLYIFPTIWTKMYYYDDNTWKQEYSHDLRDDEVFKIKNILENAIKDLLLEPKIVWGELIENRWSQVTYSLLWQHAPLEEKRLFDPDKIIRQKIYNYIEKDLSDFSIWIAGTTSIDITKKWFDKAYWISQMMKSLSLDKKDILFIWDAIFPWWNDYPVVKTGIDYKKVENPTDTKNIIKQLINKKIYE